MQIDVRKMVMSGRRLVNRYKVNFFLGENIYPEFSNIYTNVLQAISENDTEYLKRIMEPKLY